MASGGESWESDASFVEKGFWTLDRGEKQRRCCLSTKSHYKQIIMINLDIFGNPDLLEYTVYVWSQWALETLSVDSWVLNVSKCEIVWVSINDRTNLFFVSGGYGLCNRPVLNEPFWITGQSTSQAATWWTNRLLQPLNPRPPPRSRWRMAWCKGQSSYQSSWATCAGPVHHSQAKRYYTRIH